MRDTLRSEGVERATSVFDRIEQDSVSPTDGGQIRVLLVDEHEPVADTLRNILEPHDDIAFFACTDPKHALSVAKRVQPTVIFQDLTLPDGPGIELVRMLRAEPDLADVPIVVLSSTDEPAAREEAFASGADDFVVKLPGDIEVVARIRYHSRAHITHRTLKDTVRKLEMAQNQLVQSEKMASIGLLAAGVAHEINNPIAFITSNLNSLKSYHKDIFSVIDAYAKLSEDKSSELLAPESLKSIHDKLPLDIIKKDIGQILDECRDGLSRVRKIVENLKGFSRTNESQLQQTDLHAELERTLGIASNTIKYKADISRVYGDLPAVECIPSQINQVFLNLLVNAAQALNDRGTIKIETFSGPSPPGDLQQPDSGSASYAPEDPWVCVRISDTGIGIDPENLQHIFDPFFTTKPADEGTGLGLSLSNEIVQRHGGHIEVDSTLGEGTSFSVWLPVRQTQESENE